METKRFEEWGRVATEQRRNAGKIGGENGKRTNPEYFFNPETKVNFNPELSSTPIRNCEFGFWETLLPLAS